MRLVCKFVLRSFVRHTSLQNNVNGKNLVTEWKTLVTKKEDHGDQLEDLGDQWEDLGDQGKE